MVQESLQSDSYAQSYGPLKVAPSTAYQVRTTDLKRNYKPKYKRTLANPSQQ